VSSKPKQNLRVIPLGGLGEIGMNCLVFEYGDEIIIVDCGLLFTDLSSFGVEYIIPDFTYLKERADKIKGIFITHAHEDHIGALPFLIKEGIRAPIYASLFAALMIEERLKDHGVLDKAKLQPFMPGKAAKLGSFQVHPIPVNHSIVEATALFIDTPVGKIVHTGDFKFDPSPFYGRTIDSKPFKKRGSEGVRLMFSDSTNVEREKVNPGADMITESFERIFAAAEGLLIFSMFASNISRVGQVLRLAKKFNRKVMLAGRSMEQNTRIAMEAGYLKEGGDQLISIDDFNSHDRKDLIVVSTGSQGEYRSALTRLAMDGKFKNVTLEKGDLVVLSSKFIPGNELAISRVINNLFRQGANVLYESIDRVHISGHASRPELEQMLGWIKPDCFVPVHGEYRMLVKHAELARKCGVADENAVIMSNGDVLELSGDTMKIVDKLDLDRKLIELPSGNNVTREILRGRRQLAERGIIFSLVGRSGESGKVISGPEIISRGFVNEELEPEMIQEGTRIVKKIVSEYHSGLTEGGPDKKEELEENIRVALRRYFGRKMGRKPMVVPMVIDF